MQVLVNKKDQRLIDFKCKVCGEKLWKKEMKDIIMFVYGNIEHNIEAHEAFKEKSQTIYMHKSCMKSVLNNKFHDTLDLLFKK